MGVVVAFRAEGQQIGGMVAAAQGFGDAMVKLQRAVATAMLATPTGAGNDETPPCLPSPLLVTPTAPLPEVAGLVEEAMAEQPPSERSQRASAPSSQP